MDDMQNETCEYPFRVCFTADSCGDGDSSTASCWVYILSQLLVSIVFLAYPTLKRMGLFKCFYCMRSYRSKKKQSPSAAAPGAGAGAIMTKTDRTVLEESMKSVDPTEPVEFEDNCFSPTEFIPLQQGPLSTRNVCDFNDDVDVSAGDSEHLTMPPNTGEKKVSTETIEADGKGGGAAFVLKKTVSFGNSPASPLPSAMKSSKSESSLPSAVKSSNSPLPSAMRTPTRQTAKQVSFQISSAPAKQVSESAPGKQFSELFLPDMIAEEPKIADNMKNLMEDNKSQEVRKDGLEAFSKPQKSFAKDKSKNRSALVKTIRTEANFIKSNADDNVIFPSSHGPEYQLITKWNIRTVFRVGCNIICFNDQGVEMITACTGFAALSSFIASCLSLLYKYEYDMTKCTKDHYIVGLRKWFDGNMAALDIAIDGFKFLPLFLILAYVAFLVDRWRIFMVACHTIQGRIKDLAVLAGSVPSVPVSTDDRKLLFKIYRYLTVIHILVYRNFISLFKNGRDGLSTMVGLGLLTEDESMIIKTFDNKAREGVVTMALAELKELVSRSKDDIDATASAITIKKKMCELRGEMSKLHDLFIRGKF